MQTSLKSKSVCPQIQMRRNNTSKSEHQIQMRRNKTKSDRKPWPNHVCVCERERERGGLHAFVSHQQVGIVDLYFILAIGFIFAGSYIFCTIHHAL